MGPPFTFRKTLSTFQEWVNLVRLFEIMTGQLWLIRQARAGQLRSKDVSLSGSTVKLDDYLFFRAIWPSVSRDWRKFLADTTHLDEETERDAISRGFSETREHPNIPASCLADGKVQPATPPPRSNLEPESVPDAPSKKLVSDNGTLLAMFIRALADRLNVRDDMDRAQVLGPFFIAFQTFISHVDGESHRKQRQGNSFLASWLDSDDIGLDEELPTILEDVHIESPSNGRGKQQEDFTTRKAQVKESKKADTVSAVMDDPRSPVDETMTTIFMVSFFNALSAVMHKAGIHMMVPQRTQYICGPLGCSKNRPDYRQAYFRAAIDAHVASQVR